MDRATDAPDDFFIRGTRLKFEARLVKRLEQFVGALKEQSAQLAAAILGTTTHVLTSLRW
jgi:hypothetical protein